MPALLTRMETPPNSFAMRIDQRFDRRAVGDVQHAAVAAVRGEAFADGGRAAVAGRGADHGRAERGEFVGDRRADAAAGAGDQGDFALQQLFAHAWLHSVSAESISAGVPIARASSDLSMRLTRPVSTLPGPHSAMRVAPRAVSACTQPVHRTGR